MTSDKTLTKCPKCGDNHFHLPKSVDKNGGFWMLPDVIAKARRSLAKVESWGLFCVHCRAWVLRVELRTGKITVKE